jgi:hypothetical protein
MRLVRFICFVSAVLCWSAQTEAGASPKVPPQKFPFDASRAGLVLDEEFQVLEHRNYYFDLSFDYSGSDDLYRVAKLAGTGAKLRDGSYDTPGVTIPVHLKITATGDGSHSEILFDKTIDSQGIAAHGFGAKKFHGYFERRVATVELRPGRYRFQATTVRDVTEFSGTPIHFAITFHSKVLPLRD